MTSPGGDGNFSTELWRPVVEDDRYSVSSLGRVFSWRSWKLLKPTPETHGRLRVELGRGNQRFVHRLVLEAFVGPCPEGMQSRHWNDIHTDNRLENLLWGTPGENNRDQVRNGIHPQAKKTECKYGHPYSPENTKIVRGRSGFQRACLACREDNNARRREARRAA